MFWDLRDAFPFSLYRGNVEGARFDGVLPQIDTVRYWCKFSLCMCMSVYTKS